MNQNLRETIYNYKIKKTHTAKKIVTKNEDFKNLRYVRNTKGL